MIELEVLGIEPNMSCLGQTVLTTFLRIAGLQCLRLPDKSLTDEEKIDQAYDDKPGHPPFQKTTRGMRPAANLRSQNASLDAVLS